MDTLPIGVMNRSSVSFQEYKGRPACLLVMAGSYEQTQQSGCVYYEGNGVLDEWWEKYYFHYGAVVN